MSPTQPEIDVDALMGKKVTVTIELPAPAHWIVSRLAKAAKLSVEEWISRLVWEDLLSWPFEAELARRKRRKAAQEGRA